jgi:hypothetical protein
MFDSEWRQRIGVVLAVAALCCAAGGCAVDIGTTKADGSGSSNQLRYYGGPKSPMWSSQ